jgi:hypothetical protein
MRMIVIYEFSGCHTTQFLKSDDNNMSSYLIEYIYIYIYIYIERERERGWRRVFKTWIELNSVYPQIKFTIGIHDKLN